jgi:hypothetical protein
MHHPNDVPPSNDSATTDLDRVAAALRGQGTFNRAQLAWLMAAAQRWGYDVGYEEGRRDELALASIAAAYAYDGSSFDARVTERGNRQRALRQESDAAASLPRPGDYRPAGQDEAQVAA